MIELISVEVTDFRSFSHAVFTPLATGQGMTAINGANGMGKSSIVHATLWGLYGITPDGVRVGALRRQGSEGDVEAKITFRHDGQEIVVTRGLRGRNDTTVASITVDGVEVTNVSAKTATAWITARLGLDAEAFLVAFVVRQKELDSLVKARPADRRKTIERLAGIERMAAALDKARTDARAAQRLLDSLPETSDPTVAEAAVAVAQTAAQAAIDAQASAEAAAESAAQTSTDASNTAAAARSSLTAVTTAQHALDLAEQKTETAANEVDRLTRDAEGADQLDAARIAADNAANARITAEAALRDVAAIVERADSEADRAQAAEAEAERAATAVTTAQDNVKLAVEEAASLPASLEEDLKDATTLAAELSDQRGGARAEYDRLKKAIDTLTEAASHDSATCPTCNHILPDAAGLISSLEIALTEVTARGTQITEQLATATIEVERLTGLKTAAAGIQARLNAANTALAAAQEAATRANEAASRAADAAETAAEAAHNARSKASAAETTLPALRQAETTAQVTLRRAENAATAAEQLTAAQGRLAAAEEAEAQARTELTAAADSVKGIDLSLLEEAARITAAESNQAQQNAAAARTAAMLATRDLEEAQAALDRANNAAASRRNALAEVERTAAVASALEEFRRDRLARLTPELSEVASDFVARLTDGKYTSVMLDEEFTPVLTDASGAERPVAWLSGGEESAVALALRVAIGEVLAGQRGGLLILDECLTAQDAGRRQSTMAAIRALPRQVITINHVSEATDMVDLVAEVVPDGEGASTIQELAPDGPLGANVSDALLDE